MKSHAFGKAAWKIKSAIFIIVLQLKDLTLYWGKGTIVAQALPSNCYSDCAFFVFEDNKKMSNYKIVSGKTPNQLTVKVFAAKEKGWTVFGGLVVFNGELLQTMIKK